MAEVELNFEYYNDLLEELRDLTSEGQPLAEQMQYSVLSQWLDDDSGMYHPSRDRFWRDMYYFLPFDTLFKFFFETLSVMISDTTPPIQRSIRHMANAPWNIPIRWGLIECSNYTYEKRPWRSLLHDRRGVGQWDRDDLIEHLELLKDEANYLKDVLHKVENYEKFLNSEWEAGRGHGYQLPRGLIPKRRGD